MHDAARHANELARKACKTKRSRKVAPICPSGTFPRKRGKDQEL